MRPLNGRVTDITLPVRALIQRFAFFFLIFTAVALLIAGKADLVLVERLRTKVVDFATPVLHAVSHPINAANGGMERLSEFIYLKHENERLVAENRRLRRWQDISRQLQFDNEQFRRLLSVRDGPGVAFVTAQVIGDSGGQFVRTLVVNAGRGAGIQQGQAVVSDAGLVGRIVEVGEHASRILLLTDLNSRVPVMLERSEYRAILVGDNTDTPRLEFLPAGAEVVPGERLLTSGHGGLLPPGRPVGVVASVTDGVALVRPLVEWARLRYVSVLHYEFPRLDALPDEL